ncbi:MAG: hypothetical protein Q8P63_00830 [Candidatus Nealsonbacteria bacterium]|nr:hypothetical protein [Candidatus Nealsonbacteria bacterium]
MEIEKSYFFKTQKLKTHPIVIYLFIILLIPLSFFFFKLDFIGKLIISGFAGAGLVASIFFLPFKEVYEFEVNSQGIKTKKGFSTWEKIDYYWWRGQSYNEKIASGQSLSRWGLFELLNWTTFWKDPIVSSPTFNLNTCVMRIRLKKPWYYPFKEYFAFLDLVVEREDVPKLLNLINTKLKYPTRLWFILYGGSLTFLTIFFLFFIIPILAIFIFSIIR